MLISILLTYSVSVTETAAEQMATNPTRPSGQPGKMKKDESLLGKLGGTLVRKKKLKEGNIFRIL